MPAFVIFLRVSKVRPKDFAPTFLRASLPFARKSRYKRKRVGIYAAVVRDFIEKLEKCRSRGGREGRPVYYSYTRRALLLERRPLYHFSPPGRLTFPTICGLYTRVRALCVYMYIYVQRRGLSPPPSTPPICPTGRRPHVIHCGPLVRCTASLALYIYILSEMGSIYCGDDQRPPYISGRGTAVHSNKKKERINYKTLGPHTSTSAMHIYIHTRGHISLARLPRF